MLKKLNSFFAIDRQKENNKGFTIVEVMIVLAVAGLILAVVFVAVPALQRNQRNTARKSDLSYLRAQMDTAVANNSGRKPTQAQFASVLKEEELNWLGKDEQGDSISSATPPVVTVTTGTHGTADDVIGIHFYNDDLTTVQTIKNNGVGVFVGYKCSTTAPAVAFTNAMLDDAQRTSTAWVYLPEGATIPLCIDDTN